MKRFASVALCLFAAVAAAQVSRSTLTGRITDPSGAVIPGATITVTETATGARVNVVSNQAGDYTVPFLQPGSYSITVKRQGFETFVHAGIRLETEQTVSENVVLQIGRESTTVTVHGSTPLIDTATASTGQTLTAEQVEDLPSNGRTPLGFAHLEYGAVAKGKHSESQTRPFDNSTASDFSLGGGNSASNELLLNGVPNMETSARTSAFSPELDSVNAVHVDEFASDAALGDTSGGIVNITTKAGTNNFNGSLSEYYAGSRPFTAEPYFTPKGSPVQSVHFNQFGATVGGPVLIPHVINGRNKLFFFYAFEGYKGRQPATTITSVPTQAERNGDFSALLTASSSNQLYNPYSAVQSGSSVKRSAIAGNVFANAGLGIDPVAKAYLGLIPLPNYNGPSTKADGENNFFASDPTADNYYSHMGRIDYNISSSNKIFFEAHRSNYTSSQGNLFNNILTGSTSLVNMWGGQVDDVENFSPTLNLETRLGFSRYFTSANPSTVGKNPASIGFPGYVSSNSTAIALPYLTFSDNAGIPSLSGGGGSSAFGGVDAFDDVQFYASLNKTCGRHTLKFGPDVRSQKNSSLSPGNADGKFTFKSQTGDFVTSGSSGAPQAFGGALALFELGLPDSGSYDVNTKFQYDNWYLGIFAQDDWKVMPNLTISMGVRLENETPLVESNNQMVVGWDPGIVNAVTGPAAAAYAAKPNPLLPAANFNPTGGVLYASPNHRHPYNTAPLYVSPRFGFAYAPAFAHNTLAIRGGFGIFVNPFSDYNAGASYGYSQTTNMIVSINNNLTPSASLSDPFPASANPIERPFGSQYGINTNLGNSISYYAPTRVPYSEKWSLDVEKQFARNWMVEAGYIGEHSVHDSYSNDISSIPLLPFLSHSPTADPTVTNELSASTTNPFYGKIPGPPTSLNSSKTISVASLLHAYPEYTDVKESLVPGASENYNGALLGVTKRLSQDVQFTLNYEYSRQLGYTTQLNPGGPLDYEETTSDFPNHLSFMGIFQLPFGRHQPWMNGSRVLDEIFGGYSVSTIYQYLSGTPLSWGNVAYSGNFKGFNNHPHDTQGPTFNTAGFDTNSKDQPNAYNFRTFPEYVLRSDPTNNLDASVLKNFTIGDRFVIQPRVDAFNVLNRAQFQGANTSPSASSFALVTKQLNTNRQLQGGIHFLF